MATTTPHTNRTGVRLAILSLVVAAAAGALGAVAIATDDAGGEPARRAAAHEAAPGSAGNPFQAHISYVGTRADDCRIDDGQIRC
jgi:hypothetical protein